MSLMLLLFAKVQEENSSPKILFALVASEIPVLSIEQSALNAIIQKYNLTRKEEFDVAVNKGTVTKYLLEWPQITARHLLPEKISLGERFITLEWLLFPDAVKTLRNGKDKNYIQLAVQYISNGGMDQSVIAADYDEAFLKTLQKHLKDN